MDKWKAALQIAATYIGTVVGAGFASGQEILQFFTVHGLLGIAAIAVCTWLFVWLGGKTMAVAREQQCFSYRELNLHLFGNKLGWVINGIVLIILFGTTGVMLSGAGSIFAERFGIAAPLGILATIALCLLVMHKGMGGVMWVNSLVVPMMLVFTAVLIFRLAGKDLSAVPFVSGTGTEALPLLPFTLSPRIGWLVSAFLYVSFNLAMAQAVLVPMGREARDGFAVKWGGIAGGLGLGIMLLVSHLSLWLDFEQVQALDIPIAKLISSYGNGVAILFALIVYGEIFTTVIGNVFGLARQLQSAWKIPPLLGSTFVLLASFALSQWGFRSLVAMVYPLFGVVGLVLAVRLGAYRFRFGGSL